MSSGAGLFFPPPQNLKKFRTPILTVVLTGMVQNGSSIPAVNFQLQDFYFYSRPIVKVAEILRSYFKKTGSFIIYL